MRSAIVLDENGLAVVDDDDVAREREHALSILRDEFLQQPEVLGRAVLNGLVGRDGLVLRQAPDFWARACVATICESIHCAPCLKNARSHTCCTLLNSTVFRLASTKRLS